MVRELDEIAGDRDYRVNSVFPAVRNINPWYYTDLNLNGQLQQHGRYKFLLCRFMDYTI